MDLKTLSIIISLVDFLLALILLVQYRISKNYDGPGWWVLGFASTSLSFTLMLLRGFIGEGDFCIIAGNILFVASGFLIYIGVFKFIGKRLNLKIPISILLILILAMVYFTCADDRLTLRVALVAGALGVLSLLTFRALIIHKLTVIRFSAIFSGLVLAVYGLILLGWSAEAFMGSPAEALNDPNWYQAFGILVTLIIHVFLAFGLVFMVNQRVRGEMDEAKESMSLSQQMYQTFLDSTEDLIFLKDDKLQYRMTNTAQTAFFGLSEDEIIDKTDFDLMPDDAAEICQATDSEVLTSGLTRIHFETVGDRIFETRKFPVKLISGKIGVGGFIRDITKSRKAAEALDKEQYLMNALMDTLPDHIYFKDTKSRFIRINKAHADSFGLRGSDEAVGKSDFDFYADEHARKAWEDEQNIIKTGDPLFLEEKETWIDQPDTWASTVKLPLRNREGEIVGTFGISRDITGRILAEEEIQQKNRQLEKLVSEKDKLFSIIAHDLRSPFNAFLGLTELMADEEESLSIADMRRMAQTVRKSAYSLNNQLGNLLEWSRIQMDVIAVTPVAQNLRQAAETERELFAEASGQKKVTIINSIPDDIEVCADKQMLHSILRNLLANGIKFTGADGTITIHANRQSDGCVLISVSDTGIGMSEDILNSLFALTKPVYRLGTDGEPSSGLGLIICKELVEKQGGRISAHSTEGNGSTFVFTLPSQ